MTTKEFDLTMIELELVLTALRFTAEHGYTYEIEHGGDLTDYHGMKALIEKLDPKPVRKSGWMNVYPTCQADYRTVHETRELADKYANASRIKCIEVHWEE